MNRDTIINKIEKLHEEYLDYKEFYQEFEEKVFNESKKSLADKIKEPNFKDTFEKWAKDKIKLSHYRDDVRLLYNRLSNYYDFCKDAGLEEYIPEDTKITINKDTENKFKPIFVYRGDKPEEVEQGYIDKRFKEEIDIDKFLSKLQ